MTSSVEIIVVGVAKDPVMTVQRTLGVVGEVAECAESTEPSVAQHGAGEVAADEWPLPLSLSSQPVEQRQRRQRSPTIPCLPERNAGARRVTLGRGHSPGSALADATGWLCRRRLPRPGEVRGRGVS